MRQYTTSSYVWNLSCSGWCQYLLMTLIDSDSQYHFLFEENITYVAIAFGNTTGNIWECLCWNKQIRCTWWVFNSVLNIAIYLASACITHCIDGWPCKWQNNVDSSGLLATIKLSWEHIKFLGPMTTGIVIESTAEIHTHDC